MSQTNKKIFFLSDAHLGNHYVDDPKAAEAKLVRWMDHVKEEASVIYFLGDIFDYWYEYRDVVPKGHVRFLGKLAELTDRGIEVHLFIGNHDIWMFDYLPQEVGVTIHQGPKEMELLGAHFFLAHGDEVGYRPLAYRIIQKIFRNSCCQWLYAAIHPRWTFGFARGWSLSSRKEGMKKPRRKDKELDHLVAFSKEHLETHPEINFFIYGHLHLMVDLPLNATSRLLIAGDWMTLFSYIEWDGDALTMKQWEG